MDAFKLDLSSRPGTTDVWIYTTGDLDTRGALYDVDPQNPFLTNNDSFITGRRYNFRLRATLPPGIYYVGVFSFDRITTGDYTLHAEAVTDPGGTISTATRLNLSVPTPGSIGTPNDADYFRLDLTKATHLYLYALSVDGELIAGYPVDTSDRFVHSNVHVEDGWFFIRDEFDPGTTTSRSLRSVASRPIRYPTPSMRTRSLHTQISWRTARPKHTHWGTLRSVTLYTDVNGICEIRAGRISTSSLFGQRA